MNFKRLVVRTQIRVGTFSMERCADPRVPCPTMECRPGAFPYRVNQKYALCLNDDLAGCLALPGSGYCETRSECQSLCGSLSGELRKACLDVCAGIPA